MAVQQFVVGSTNLLRLSKLKDVDTGAYVEDADVTATLLVMPAGTPVAGAEDISMPKKDGTAGATTLYQGYLDDTVALVVGGSYKLRVEAVVGLSKRTFFLSGVAVEKNA